MSDRDEAASPNISAGSLAERGAIRSPFSYKVAMIAARDGVAGLVSSIVLIANIVSFGALMFPGELSPGVPVAIWSMLIGGCVCGIWIAATTSLPPLATGIDSPTGIVLVLLSVTAGSNVLAAGGTPHAAVQTVMLIFTGATLMSGVLLFALGHFRLGSYFRFVPYFVVGGFLAATGVFLVSGGIRMATGRAFGLASLAASWAPIDMAKLGAAAAVLAVLFALRRWAKWPFALPTALIVMWLGGAGILHNFGLSSPESGWYFHSLGYLHPWMPIGAIFSSGPEWRTMFWLIPEMLTVTIVAIISLITKVASIEVARQVSGDLDREFRGHGIGCLLSAPLGGLTSSLQIGTSRLLEHAGGMTRFSGVMCSLVLGLVGLASFDLPGIIPIPIIAGLVFYLGYTFLVDALWQSYSQRAWLDLLLSLGIMAVCLKYGYLAGVLVGLVGACVLFAFNYARFDVVRQHASRAQFASHVDRSAARSALLRDRGDAIQLYWLSGYIFFGSSERAFDRIRSEVEALPDRTAGYVILDFSLVSGADSSAIVSLSKLRKFCDQHRVVLAYSALPLATQTALELRGFFAGKGGHRAFHDLNAALAWCEEKVLADAQAEPDTSLAGFESWLHKQFGGTINIADLMTYLQRKDLQESEVVYREGEPADTVDLVAAGNLAINVAAGDGVSLNVRRITTHTVVGEMGFFRQVARSATVEADGPVTLFTLTRRNFERMRRERPDLASAFDDFIMRTLADRIDFANRTVAALSRS